MKTVIKYLICLCVALASVNVAQAQRERPKNLPNYDKKYLHFGFMLGINYGNSIIRYNADRLYNDSLLALLPIRQPGFGLGIVTNFQFAKNFDLRFIPSLSFITRQYSYRWCVQCRQQYPTDTTVIKTVESTQIDLPLMVKFKSERVNNYRWYLLGGMRYSIDLASNKDLNVVDQPLKFEKNDLAYEFGVGMDLYLSYFKFSPEIKYSFGTKDMLVHDKTVFSNPIQSLRTKTIFISFLFE